MKKSLSSVNEPPEFIKLLANDVRWGILSQLALSDHKVNELVNLTQQPVNLVSYHLKKLRDESLVSTRRSEADGRDVYYTLELDRLRDLYVEAGSALHPLLNPRQQNIELASVPAARVLIVCTHNSARSQMAQGLMIERSKGKIAVFSAGSHPTHIHPDAIRTMDNLGIDIRNQSVHHLSDFEGQPFDYVITICDKARENCPTYPGEGQQMHWGFPDPTAVEDRDARLYAFAHIAQRLRVRIEHFLVTLMSNNNRR